MPIRRRRSFPEETFAQRLRLKMMQKGLNASELARLVEVSATCVWNWQQGNTHPGPTNLAALSEVLDVEEEYLRDGPIVESDNDSGNDDTEPKSIAEMIENLRCRIATEMGLDVERVKLSLELVSG